MLSTDFFDADSILCALRQQRSEYKALADTCAGVGLNQLAGALLIRASLCEEGIDYWQKRLIETQRGV